MHHLPDCLFLVFAVDEEGDPIEPGSDCSFDAEDLQESDAEDLQESDEDHEGENVLFDGCCDLDLYGSSHGKRSYMYTLHDDIFVDGNAEPPGMHYLDTPSSQTYMNIGSPDGSGSLSRVPAIPGDTSLTIVPPPSPSTSPPPGMHPSLGPSASADYMDICSGDSSGSPSRVPAISGDTTVVTPPSSSTGPPSPPTIVTPSSPSTGPPSPPSPPSSSCARTTARHLLPHPGHPHSKHPLSRILCCSWPHCTNS